MQRASSDLRVVAAVLLVACTASAPTNKGGKTNTDTDTTVPTPTIPTTPDPTEDTSHTGLSGETGDTGDTGSPPPVLPTFDCANVPAQFGVEMPLQAPRGYNDVVFDSTGGMIGWDGNGLVRATDAVTIAPFSPGVGMVYKMGILPSGDIVSTAANRDVLITTPAGVTTTLAPGVAAYGLAIGNDGNVYVATNYTSGFGSGILRITPLGDTTLLLPLDRDPPRAIDFSRDYSALYFGTLDGGKVYRIPLDANLDPTGDPVGIVTMPRAWHDTLEVDACGNIYVGSVFGAVLWRVDSNYQVTEMIDWPFNDYGHGLQWGSSNGAWDDQTIYVTHPYINQRMTEINIGVPGRLWQGTVIGGVTL